LKARALPFACGVAFGAVIFGASVPGCNEPESRVEYEPYAGPPAYPDRRSKVPPAKGVLGFVSDSGSDTVTVIDVPSNEVVAQVPVGRDPVAIDGPHHLALGPDGRVFVALSYPAPAILPGPHAAHASASRPGFVLALDPSDLRTVAEVQIEANPGEIVLSPDGRRLVVTHFDLTRAIDPRRSAEEQKASLMIVDPAMLQGTGSPPPNAVRLCRAPHGASISADSRTAYVACYADDALAIVDLDAPTAPPTLVPVGSKGPYSAVVSPSGRFVAVGNTDGRDTRLLDTQSKSMGAVSFPSPGAPYFAAWSPDESTLWIPTQAPDELVAVTVATGAVARRHSYGAECIRPHEAQLAPDGATVYVVCEGDHVAEGAVLAVDPVSLETRASMKVGVYPDRLMFARPR
jgi:YVTN family beta-propeller protein